MPGGKQENLRPHYEGPPPSSFRAGDILGPKYLSSLYEGSSGLSDLLTPSPPTVFLDPAAQLTDDLLETMGDLCRCEAVNSFQMYFFNYILYHSCTGKPKFSY
jgi:hypothetical protein